MTRLPSPRRLVGLVLLAGACSAGAAPDLASIPLDQLLDLEVSAASKRPLRVSQSASSATVISADEIRAMGWRTLAEVLQSVRGVLVSSDRTYAYIGVRGFAPAGDYNTRILLLIDGNRVNDTVFDQAVLDSGLPLDLALVERVEFIPGQGSAVHGANALFGVVNIVTRRAGSGPDGELEAAGGSGAERGLRLTGRHRLGHDGAILLSASSRRSNGTDARYPAPDGDGSRLTSHRTDHERGERLELKVEQGELSGSLRWSDRVKGLSATAGTVFGDPGNAYRDTYALADLTLAHRLADGDALKLRAYAGEYRFRGDFVVDYPPVTLNQDRAESRWWGLETNWVGTRIAGHVLALGADLQVSPRRDQSNLDVDPASEPYLDDRRRSMRESVFAEDQWSLAPAVTLTTGLRYDRLRGDTRSSQWSPRLALVARPDETLVLKLIHGRAFRAPNAYESHYAIAGTVGYKGNDRLQNESVRGSEAVLEYRPSAATRWTVALHETRADRLLVQAVDPADHQLVYDNAGALRARGLEVELEQAAAGGVHLRANYSLEQVKDMSGLDLGSRNPRHMGKLMLIAPVAGGWTAGLQALLVARRGAVPGYGTTQLTFSSGFGDGHGRFSASVRDLLDRRPDDPGGDSVLQPVAPQDGRSLFVGAEWSF